MNPAKFNVAIIGSGNIGTDLMIKVMRNAQHLEMGAMVGIDPASDGLERARRLGVAGRRQKQAGCRQRQCGMFELTHNRLLISQMTTTSLEKDSRGTFGSVVARPTSLAVYQHHQFLSGGVGRPLFFKTCTTNSSAIQHHLGLMH